MSAVSGCVASPSRAGHLGLDAWWRNSPWPGGANCAAHHRQEIIVDQSLRCLCRTYFAPNLGTGFCGNSSHALFAPRTLGSKKLRFARLGVQLFDETRKRVRAGYLKSARVDEKPIQLRDAGFAAPLAVVDQFDYRIPHSFDLLGGSSAATFQFRALRGPLTLGAFRPIPSIKIAGADNKNP